ncbi:energy-coupling factor transporter transmembrane component T family protein [Vibrio hannami]
MKASKITFGINYIDTGSPLHKLNGITKFALFIAWTTVVLTTFDLRLIVGLLTTGLLLLKLSAIPFRIYKPLLIATGGVLLLNAFFIYLLAPGQGTEYLGSETVLLTLPYGYSITQETIFYLITVTLKYFSTFPIALVFVFTTHPTEFAASLNKLGVPYKISYAVSLTLRYLPEIKKDFVNIMHAQQARGIELSKKAPFFERVKSIVRILGPLIFSSLDKADDISNAMTLRGFGRHDKRTWYSLKPIRRVDVACLVFIFIVVALAITKRVVEEQLFWYPF